MIWRKILYIYVHLAYCNIFKYLVYTQWNYKIGKIVKPTALIYLAYEHNLNKPAKKPLLIYYVKLLGTESILYSYKQR